MSKNQNIGEGGEKPLADTLGGRRGTKRQLDAAFDHINSNFGEQAGF
jgi:hypothetical protein